MKQGQIKIFNSLVNAKEGLSFTELRKQTGLSKTALSEYIREMLGTGLLRKEHGLRKYVLPYSNMPMKNFERDWHKLMRASVVNFVRLGQQISEMQDHKERVNSLQIFLQYSFHMLTLLLWKTIGEATNEYAKDVLKLKKQLSEQKLAVRKSQLIHETMENWIVGMADSLATAMVLNGDILDDAGTPIFKGVLEEAKRNMENLLKLVGTMPE